MVDRSVEATWTLSEQLATALEKMSFQDLPAAMVNEGKRRILDFLAVTVPAWDIEKSAQVAAAFARRNGAGSADATLLALGDRVTAPMAAFANGIASHSLEIDDDHNKMVGHPGVGVLPAVLAVGERVGASGRDAILAAVIGYDVVIRTAQAVDSGVLHHRGWHPTGTNGVFGATAASAKLMGLNVEQIANAFGIAGSQSSGLWQALNEGALTKRFHAGWAAQNGVIAAELAELGYTGPKQIFEGKHGWYSTYAPEGTYDLDKVMDQWGIRFEMAHTSWKPYACCRYCHPSIDCAFALREMLGGDVDPDEIESIDVRIFKEALFAIAEPYDVKVRPRNTVDAQFSTFYAVAVALLTGRALLDEFSAEAIKDPVVLGLAAKVKISDDEIRNSAYPELYPSKVIINFRDGRVLEHEVSTAKGDPEWDLTSGELEQRFRTLAGRVFSEGRLGEILHAVRTLDQMNDIRELTALCVKH